MERGAQAHGFEADLWTLERVGVVVERVTGVSLSRASVWRLLTGRLGWSLQRPERRAVERDESEIARWIAHGGPRIKEGGEHTCLDRVPQRVGRLPPAPGPPHLRASRPHAASAAPAEPVVGSERSLVQPPATMDNAVSVLRLMCHVRAAKAAPFVRFGDHLVEAGARFQQKNGDSPPGTGH
ncbi:winged helix-turn-helix domain-containing protein [Streptomyces sp. NPDC059352]|uniref:winged helix-turn-helix domain-containing protein n=1 Tax=Streptomyces sp. NPDC059352 TaxID=3346810 RepID=UPI0036AA90A3